MFVFNDLTKKEEEFKVKNNSVKIYVCGPTVYDYGHLGHARSAIAFDIIRKFLIYLEYKVNYAMNVTDIDDKMIQRANKEKTTVKELAEKFTKYYFEDMKELNVLYPDKMIKATETIDYIIKIIKKLQEKGYTYETSDGVYFEVRKFKKYGRLIKLNKKDAKKSKDKSGEDKKDAQDFALWKKQKPNEPAWNSPWGKGRPGWHIECSAMILKHLGETIDIHGGGSDLIFPHHENEIAQSEAANGKPLARYWMHNNMVKVDDTKMSKSLGNFFTIRDILKKYNYRVIRFFLIGTHYRSPINFSEENLINSKNSLEKIDRFLEECKSRKDADKKSVDNFLKDFENAMKKDFDTPKAIAIIFNFIKELNKEEKGGKIAFDAFVKIDSVLGIMKTTKDKIPAEIKKLAEEREKARKNKDFKKADQLRNKIQKRGFLLEDSSEGVKIKQIS
ncbi:cysteine--tRNA ligase [Candidatus Woesearchaeota archaeon]|nr:hypothetical protein [uncultured archaeon]MBS3167296.1 cysteine--tRNA ligase [Candidatus Woesearchaeota archaeon]